MPRLSREEIFNESECFHILVQGIEKSYIFDSDMKKNCYLELLNEKRKIYSISILAYCIMGNHAHLLVFAKDKQNISKCMKETNTEYAHYYNIKNNRVGYVFRGRFKAEPIIGEEYLINCISYIHLNPVKANIVEVAEGYRFSSAIGYQTRQSIVDFEAIENILGGLPELTEPIYNFYEDEYDGKLDPEQAITLALSELGIEKAEQLKDEQLLLDLICKIRKSTKISLRELANVLELNREYVRLLVKSMSNATSP